MEVAVMTAKRWPVRAMRRARMGSFSGTVAGSGPADSSLSVSSATSCSTDLIAGVTGVMGVVGLCWPELESAAAADR